MISPLGDAFSHHIWATERLIDACATLTPEQLAASVPGTFGPIAATLAHQALTSNGIEPSEIDLWAYGEATGRTRAVEG